MEKNTYLILLKELAEMIDEGIICFDQSAVAIFYNQKMLELEGLEGEEIIGKTFKEIYPNLPEDVSTLIKAIRKGEPTIEKQQTYVNKFYNEVTTINTTVPLMLNGEVIGALEVAKDVTKLKSMSAAITSYQKGSARNKKADEDSIKRYSLNDIVGRDPNLLYLKERVRALADIPYPVLIYGETGTGKELFAQSIHYIGKRADRPFLAQNCAAMPSSLLESILFGTVKGGFTGAEDMAGLFEQASGGTLLLDEISAMPYNLQSKLLRVLQEGYVRRIGGTKDIPVDVRVIAVTNEPLDDLIENRKFRKDLFYRLNAVSMTIPPLRNRKKDIPILAEHFISKHNELMGKNVKGITDEAVNKLKSYDYPGNIRELENILITAITTLGEGDLIKADNIVFRDIPPLAVRPFDKETGAAILDGMSLTKRMKEIEEEIIEKVMEENGGNITKSARQLGINRQNLQYKLRKRGR